MTHRMKPLVGTCLIGLLMACGPALANFSFAISPPRFELTAKPGERVRQVIEVTNVAVRPNTLLIKTADWELKSDESVTFQEELRPGSCRPWVAIERREMTVGGGQPYRFRFEVTAPAAQPPTECRFAILMEGKDASYAGATGAVPVGARVGVIVYVAVGDVKPELSIVGARIEVRNGQPTPVLDVRNAGTAHGRLDGFLSGTDADGQPLDITPGNNPILPGETRAIPLSLAKRGDAQTAVQAKFPLTVKGKLEWGKGRSITLDQRFEK